MAGTLLLAAAGPVAGAMPECVVLLHGLGRTEKSMARMARYLEAAGYATVNVRYPSRRKTIEALSAEVLPAVIGQCGARGTSRIHFVTHSMGGILIRCYLAHHDVERLGRVVMLSPPNHGSEVVDALRRTPILKWIYGPAVEQLGTDAGSLPRRLGPAAYELGIITGDRSIDPVSSLLIRGRDDGKVSVESAKLAGMKDFLIVHKSHPFIMNDAQVMRQVRAFIAVGAFIRE